MTDPHIVRSESSSILKVKDGQTKEILSNFLREGETQMSHGLSNPGNGGGGGGDEEPSFDVGLYPWTTNSVQQGSPITFFGDDTAAVFDHGSVSLKAAGDNSAGNGTQLALSSRPASYGRTYLDATVPSDFTLGNYNILVELDGATMTITTAQGGPIAVVAPPALVLGTTGVVPGSAITITGPEAQNLRTNGILSIKSVDDTSEGNGTQLTLHTAYGQVAATIPEGTAYGDYHVIAELDGETTDLGTLTVVPAIPAVDGLSPSTASNDGGTIMTFTGEGFAEGNQLFTAIVFNPSDTSDIEQSPWEGTSISVAVQSDTEATFEAPYPLLNDGNGTEHDVTNSTAGVLLKRYTAGFGDQTVWVSYNAYTYE